MNHFLFHIDRNIFPESKYSNEFIQSVIYKNMKVEGNEKVEEKLKSNISILYSHQPEDLLQKRSSLLPQNVFQLNFFEYMIPTDSSILQLDHELFYDAICYLVASQKYIFALYLLNKYLKCDRDIYFERAPSDYLSMLYIFYAKSLEGAGFDDLRIFEAFETSYAIDHINLIGLYEMIAKCRRFASYKLGLHYALPFIRKFIMGISENHIDSIRRTEFDFTQLLTKEDIGCKIYDDFIRKSIVPNKYFNKENIYIYLFYLEFEIILCAKELIKETSEESQKRNYYALIYHLCNRIMLRPRFTDEAPFPEQMIKDLQYMKAECIDSIKDLYIQYNPQKVQTIVDLLNQSQKEGQKEDKKIIFTITTCKRFDLFEKTMNSLLNCTSDRELAMIGQWLCVDDNSCAEDREKMMQLYPFFTFHWKSPEQKGHIQSMNIIRNYVLQSGFPYTFHMEDDWQSVCAMNYIERSLEIMAENPRIKQVIHNRNYGQLIRAQDIELNGGILSYTSGSRDRYVLHQFIHQESPEFAAYLERIGRKATMVNWPHYSLNPSILDVEVYRRCGAFEKVTWHFEFDYANRFLCAGFQTAFLDGIFRLHIGKILGSTVVNEKNAYELNEEAKFEFEE